MADINPSKINHSPATPVTKDRRKKAAVFAVGAITAAIILAALALGGYLLWQRLYKNNGVPGPNSISSKATPTAEPTNLSIPSLHINASFEKLALQPDHAIEVPKSPGNVGWFIHGAKPGDVGPAVVIGHLDSTKGKAVFADLRNIKHGDLVNITRADGSSVAYKIDSVSKYSQDNFPTQAVYGTIDYAGLRLITCAGTYSKQKGRYSDNLIAFGKLVK